MTDDLAPIYLQTLLPQPVQQQSRYSLRYSNNYTIPLTRTVSYFNSFLPTALREWNSLDQTTRDCATLGTFKRNAPVNQPPVYFDNVKTSRKAQILYSRLRLEFSFFNQHLCRNNLVASPNCSCGMIESFPHFLLSCLRYTHIR